MNKLLLTAALAGVLAANATNAHAADATGKEKCYGIAKAGKNDCKSANGSHSCQGLSSKDNDKDDFKLVSTGECAKDGGMTDPATKSKM